MILKLQSKSRKKRLSRQKSSKKNKIKKPKRIFKKD